MKIDDKSYFLLSAIGLLLFFTLAFSFSFKDKVFLAFFPKSFSFAEAADNTPGVEIIAGVDNSFRRGVVNLENGKSNILLKWKVTKTAKNCLGRFWSNVEKSDPWSGEKDRQGGEYQIDRQLPTGIYVYSINCANESGDSAGSSVTINAGAKPSYLQPHITSFKAFKDENNQYEAGKMNVVEQNTKVSINWESLNTGTAFGICAASGSWPTIYQNTGSLPVKETFVLDKVKVYKYYLFCSNENGYDTQEISFMVR